MNSKQNCHQINTRSSKQLLSSMKETNLNFFKFVRLIFLKSAKKNNLGDSTGIISAMISVQFLCSNLSLDYFWRDPFTVKVLGASDMGGRESRGGRRCRGALFTSSEISEII